MASPEWWVRYHWQLRAAYRRTAALNCGCLSSTDHEGRQFWVVAAERENAGRFIGRAHDLPTAFLELQTAIHGQIELG